MDVWPTVTLVEGGEDWTLYCGDSDGSVSAFQRNLTFVSTPLDDPSKRGVASMTNR